MNWTQAVGFWRYGTIRTTLGYSYTFDQRDAMWLVRALVGETGDEAGGEEGRAVAWTMINRLVLVRGDTFERRDGLVLRPPHRLADILLSYCQPINPYWRNRGTEAEVRRRNFFATMGPNDVPPAWTYPELRAALQQVWRLTTGRLQAGPYVGLVHFGARTGSETFYAQHGTPDLQLDDLFWKVPETRSWTADTVRTVQAGTPLIPTMLAGAAVAGLAIAATSSKGLGVLAALPFLPP